MEPLRRGVKPKRVAKYSDFGPFQDYISKTVQGSRKVTINHSRIWALDWCQNRWPWMTLNGVIALTVA